MWVSSCIVGCGKQSPVPASSRSCQGASTYCSSLLLTSPCTRAFGLLREAGIRSLDSVKRSTRIRGYSWRNEWPLRDLEGNDTRGTGYSGAQRSPVACKAYIHRLTLPLMLPRSTPAYPLRYEAFLVTTCKACTNPSYAPPFPHHVAGVTLAPHDLPDCRRTSLPAIRPNSGCSTTAHIHRPSLRLLQPSFSFDVALAQTPDYILVLFSLQISRCSCSESCSICCSFPSHRFGTYPISFLLAVHSQHGAIHPPLFNEGHPGQRRQGRFLGPLL
jgi:hypothetical protein